MKFERWDKNKGVWVHVDLNESDYFDMLLQYDIINAEMDIEERIEMLKWKQNHNVDQFWNTEPIIFPKYD